MASHTDPRRLTVHAEVVRDSVSPDGSRLTTVEVTLHRFVLAELNTHRAFCLAGDVILEFDLPAGSDGGRRVHYTTIADFVDRWKNGARRQTANPKSPLPLDRLVLECYSAPALAEILDFSKAEIHRACRDGDIEGVWKRGRTWMVPTKGFVEWRQSTPEHTRFDIRDRLSGMAIRQLDESTGDIVTSTVVDAIESGMKPVYELRAGDFSVAGSADHRIYTEHGWLRLGDITPGTGVVVKKFGKRPEDRVDPLRLKKIGGKWRTVWQRGQRDRLLEEHGGCQKCGSDVDLHVHQLAPVHEDPSLAFDEGNVILVCAECHKSEHSTQGWQGGTYLYGSLAEVDEVIYRGMEMTYDLEIAGDYPNFLANGVVVHNSRNSASSRAIPVEKQLERVVGVPAWPLEWPCEQPGMQGGSTLEGDDRLDATMLFADVWDYTTDRITEYLEAHPNKSSRLHKSLVNRLLEPFMWHTVIISSTELGWHNFFLQRVSPLAQPEIREAAQEILRVMLDSTPTEVDLGGWHLPYIQPDEDGLDMPTKIKLATARCARVSYLTHDGVRDHAKDIELYERLVNADPPHWSPLEHVAFHMPGGETAGNFDGWDQLRHVVQQDPGFI